MLFFAILEMHSTQKQLSKTKFHTIANYKHLFEKNLPKIHFPKGYTTTKELQANTTIPPTNTKQMLHDWDQLLEQTCYLFV
jgi:hypothetical protein